VKASFKVGPKAVVEAEGETVKQVFERLGDLAACLGADDKCGCCGSDKIVPSVTRPQSYVYYSLKCLACEAQLTFGQTKEGERLFPKRDKGKNGWEVYQAGQQTHSAPPTGQNRSYQPHDPLPY
jgi:hypothetical protein